MNAFPRTSAPRSSVIHGLGQSGRVTVCGRRIGDNWAGEYDAMPVGAISCGRCLTGIDPREAGPVMPDPTEYAHLQIDDVFGQAADEARDLASFDAQQTRLRREVPPSVMSLPAAALEKGDFIHFGDEWVTVVGVDIAPGCDPVVITEDSAGSQFIDYVSPARIFAAFCPTV